MPSFEKQYPNISAWVQDGQVEIGYGDDDDVFLRVTDAGGVVWESSQTYASLDEALAAMDAAIATWCAEQGIELIDVSK
jgi:hypothetical protein